MAKKFYTLREIVELLNDDLEKTDLSYRYTEQAVRSRLRYLQSKGVGEQNNPIITPKTLSYDRRTKYYTEEDVQKLRNIWIGPMLAEFYEYPEDLERLEEVDEVEVRPAEPTDIESMTKIYDLEINDEMSNHLLRLLKEPNAKMFVAVNSEGEVVGWSQAKISFGLSVAEAHTTGEMIFYVSHNRSYKDIAVRSLLHRAQSWLRQRNARDILLMVPTTMNEFEDYVKKIYLSAQIIILHPVSDN